MATGGVGRGSVCWFRGPISPDPGQPSRKDAESGAPLLLLSGDRHPCYMSRMNGSRPPHTTFVLSRILLADDNAVSRVPAELVLREAGYAVDRVRDGRTAFEAAAMVRYGVILLELTLPYADGCDAARRIRDWEAAHGKPRVPIVAVTRSRSTLARERALAAGMDAFVLKPFRPGELLATVRLVMAAVSPSGGDEAVPAGREDLREQRLDG